MRSPFPGMDPYLEHPGLWPDFHARFLTYCSEAIADRLPGNYMARIESQLKLVEAAPDEPRRVKPDIVFHSQGNGVGSGRGVGAATAAVAVLEPVEVAEI